MKPAPAWYAIQSSADSQAAGRVEISLYDEIGLGGATAKDFLAELKKYKGQHIDLRINSVGGSVIEGAAIYNSLRRHKGGLTVHVDGLAASMASVIAMAGEEIYIADNAMFMIHNPWSMTMGDADDLRKEAAVLDKLKNTLVNAYARRTGMEASTIAAMMDEETWLDATESVAMGFADEIEDGTQAAACLSPRVRFDNFSNSMARKSSKIQAEEAAPVAPPVDIVAEPMNVEPAAVALEEADPVTEPVSQEEQIETLETEVARLAAEALEKDEEIAALKSELARLGSESEEKEEEMAALRAASKSAGQQAAAIVASVGLDVSAVAPAETELTAAQKFAALEGHAATEFYRAHKREIFSTLVL
jgi:ATP-dependent Clp endopeptidase proteolytic subunit ClpP